MKKGILYIVVGESFFKMAEESAKSAKKYNPNLSIHVFTDQEQVESPYIDSFATIVNPNRRSKVDYISESPFERTLFLDADTRIVENIEPLFDLLDYNDICLAHAHMRYSFPTNQIWRKSIPYAFPQLNSGVVLFRNAPKVISLLRDWKKMFHKYPFKKDQVTLRELLWESDLRMLILPPEYNVRFEKYLDRWKQEGIVPKILHFNRFRFKYQALDAVSKSIANQKDYQSLMKKMKWLWKELPSWKSKFGIE